MARPRDRFFLEGVHAAGARVAFAPDDARKLSLVLRAHDGDAVTVIDSAGVQWAAIVSLDGGVFARLTQRIDSAREPGARVVLAQCIPKGQKMDFVVEKATELGVSTIVPVRSARVEGERTGDAKLERWQRLARSAAQQSGRTVVPHIAPICEWNALLPTFAQYDRVYVAWEVADAVPLRDSFESDALLATSVLFIIGPEGGLTHGEIALAESAGASAISLGARILRTETAALVTIAAWNYARGE